MIWSSRRVLLEAEETSEVSREGQGGHLKRRFFVMIHHLDSVNAPAPRFLHVPWKRSCFAAPAGLLKPCWESGRLASRPL